MSPIPDPPDASFERDAWTAYSLIGQYLISTKMEMRRTAAHSPGAPAPHHIHAMIFLASNEGTTITALATALGVTQGRASRLTDELVGAGMIERRRDEHDRRIVHLHLSEQARAVSRIVFTRHGDPIRRALEPLDRAGRVAVMAFLSRLVEEQEARVRAPPFVPTVRIPSAG